MRVNRMPLHGRCLMSDDGVTSPRVAVVVLNWNGWRDTLACVRSVLAHADPSTRVVVCDNGSTDGSCDRLREAWVGQLACLSADDVVQGTKMLDQRVWLVQNGANLGFAGGCNTGVRLAMACGFDFIWLLNNDTEVEAGAQQALVARMRQDDSIGLCGSRLVYFDDPQTVQARGGAVYNAHWGIGRHLGVHESVTAPEDAARIEAQMDYVVGASMMASRTFVEAVGPMTEDYFLYFEELDWAVRGKDKGFRLGYAATSVVRHKEGATIGSSHRGTGSMLSMQYLSRNRLKFTARFYPQWLNSVRRRMAYEAMVYVKRRQWAAARIVLQSLMGKVEA